MDEETIEEDVFGARRKPEDQHEKAHEEKDLEETDRDSRKLVTPGERNTQRIDRADGAKNERSRAENCRDDRDKLGVEFQTTEETPDGRALEQFYEDRAKRHQPDEAGDPEKRDMMPAEIEKRLAQPGKIHVLSSLP